MRLYCQSLGTRCREWPPGKASAEVQILVKTNSKPHGIVICRNGSVTRGLSGWGFTVKQGERTVHKHSGIHSHDLQSYHRSRSSHTCNTVASLPTGRTNHTCHHSHRLNGPAAEGGDCPVGTHTCRVFDCHYFCGSSALGIPESVEMNGQIDWQAQQISQLVCSLTGQRCSEA